MRSLKAVYRTTISNKETRSVMQYIADNAGGGDCIDTYPGEDGGLAEHGDERLKKQGKSEESRRVF